MNKAIFIGIFSLLALSQPHLAIAQGPGTNGSLKTTESAAAASSAPVDVALEAQKNYDAGFALYESGKFKEAIVALKQANKLRPNDAQTQYILGMAYMKSKSYIDATECFKRAVRLKPEWPEAQFRLGLMFYVFGRKAQADEAYKRLVELNSPLASTLYRINNGSAPTAGDDAKGEPAPPATKQVEAVPVSAPAANAPSIVSPSPVVSDAKNSSTTSPSSSESNSPLSSPAADPASSKATVTNSSETTAPVTRIETSDSASSNKAVNMGSAEPMTRIPNPDSAVNIKTASDGSLPTETYKIGVADVLDIRLLNATSNRSTLYSVLDGGVIDFPLGGGAIPVAGLTLKEIQARITSELKRLAVEEGSQVTVGVRQYASHTVVVTGLVTNPGTKFLRREAVPLYVLLAEVQPRLDAARAVIIRAGNTGQVVDLNDSAALQFIVRPGDVINVIARSPEFYYIAGRVNSPGQKNFQPGITLVQAILAAGGLARDSEVDLSREGADGRLTTTKFNLKDIKSGTIQDPKLQPGDRIEVFRKAAFRL